MLKHLLYLNGRHILPQIMRNKILILLFASTFANFLDQVLPKICPDEDIAAKCEGQCEVEYLDCTLACTDTSCLIECGRALTDCVQDCPCNLNCPNGCSDCPNSICVCGENPSPQNEDNLQTCMKEKSIDLGQCIIDCANNQSCEQSCVSLFKDEYEECPCQDECLFGCPCESFDCQPDKKSVLVLNTRYSSNKPVLIKYEGGVEENLDFTMGSDTSVYKSCSAMLNGELFVFGGSGSQIQQISKILNCTLKRIGTLPNPVEHPACGTFLFDGDERVMFCFPKSDKNKCFSYNGEKYTYHRDSVNDHYDSKLGDIGNKVLAVGSYSPSDNKVELFDIDSNTWTSKASFPFCSTRISDYGLINRESSVLIIGGVCDDERSTLIAKYTIDKWERKGYLQVPRRGHQAIANTDRIYVVGGYDGTFKTEIWSLDEDDNTVNMKIAEPNLHRYEYYPELFIVESDFCTKK